MGIRRREARTHSRVMPRCAVLLAAIAGAVLFAPAGASATPPSSGCDSGTTGGDGKITYECNVSTGIIGGYEVRQWYDVVPNPLKGTPYSEADITHMETDVVDDATGDQVPIQRLMLHHIVFTNLA